MEADSAVCWTSLTSEYTKWSDHTRVCVVIGSSW